MEIVKKLEDFIDEIDQIGMTCIAENDEVYFGIYNMTVNENNRQYIYNEAIKKISMIYHLKIMTVTSYKEDNITYLKIMGEKT